MASDADRSARIIVITRIEAATAVSKSAMAALRLVTPMTVGMAPSARKSAASRPGCTRRSAELIERRLAGELRSASATRRRC